MGGSHIVLLVWILRAWPGTYAYLDISQEPDETTFTEEEKPPGFMNRTEFLELVTNEKYDDDSAVQTFITAYNFNKLDSCKKYFPTGIKRSTFIVIEGQQRTKRFGLAKRLAKVLKGNLVYNPPKGYAPFRRALKEAKLVTAFYSLCLYITAKHVRKHAIKRPVVVSGQTKNINNSQLKKDNPAAYLLASHEITNRYYIGQKAFSVAKNYFPRLPPLNSSQWTWPDDLLIPDLVFNLMTPIDYDTDIETRVFINYTQAIINAWPDPKVIPVYNVTTYEDMIEEILPRVFTMLE